MRRATTTATGTHTRSVDHARVVAQQDVRIRGLEAAVAIEQHRREALELKYARLKRKYARLEQAHTALQHRDSSASIMREAPGVRRTRSPFSSSSSTASANSPSPPPVGAVRVPATSTRFPLQQEEEVKEDGDVIDLTSPVGSRRTSLASPGAAATRHVRQMPASDDYIAESPLSPLATAAVEPHRREAEIGFVTRRMTRASASRAGYGSDPLPPPPPPVTTATPRVSGIRRRQLDFQMPDPMSRGRPRLGPNPSDDPQERLPVRGGMNGHRSDFVLDQETADRRRTRSPVVEESKSDTEADTHRAVPVQAAGIGGDDSDEAASLALAQYLQRQENLAAMEEYQERLRALEESYQSHHHTHHHHTHNHEVAPAAATPHGGRHHDAAVDPDTMTYEELLQLGEDVGDVKKERWRRVAVHVLSRLPTHRWSTNSSDDISCIICQYGFSVGDVALTLPCAHVFHEECVSGWVRENNSCPLCKLEIAEI